MLRLVITNVIVSTMKSAGYTPNPHIYSVLLKAFGNAELVAEIGKAVQCSNRPIHAL